MIRLLSLFSGIGAFEKAFKNIGIDYELVNYCEIDRFASKSYCLIHNEDENKNLWDINKVDPKNIPIFDLMTYGFPCQSFSLAGKRLGLKDPVKGNLFFESMRIAKEKKPRYMIAENVKGLLSDDNGDTMSLIITTLNKLGYNNYFQVLNAKDYGIPQNRERIFIISIRKDIDNLSFEFPKKIKLNKKLKDLLEKNVKQKCSDKMNKFLEIRIKIGFCKDITNEDYSGCLRATSLHFQCIKIAEKEYRLLTPLECFRLIGFEDNDFFKLEQISNTQKYKQAGNSIVVQVLEGILKNLFQSDNKKKWLF